MDKNCERCGAGIRPDALKTVRGQHYHAICEPLYSSPEERAETEIAMAKVRETWPKEDTATLERTNPMNDPRFTRYRADGWPICPQCDEDELYSHVCMGWDGSTPRPTMAECLAGEFTCYRCNWASDGKRIIRAAEVLERLIDFAVEDVADMPPEQVEAALVAEGVDLDAMKIRLRQRLEAIREKQAK